MQDDRTSYHLIRNRRREDIPDNSGDPAASALKIFLKKSSVEMRSQEKLKQEPTGHENKLCPRFFVAMWSFRFPFERGICPMNASRFYEITGMGALRFTAHPIFFKSMNPLS